ncbi:hypothetical protein PCK1_001482 [Pneumocystis canis]|nr:hypothetical protein PCK1_001482 [Pneumocystis canis]
MFSNNVYNVSSKIIAIIASPWIVILIALVFIFSLYLFYYRPRLHYPYPSYPSSPIIYFSPPWKRIRDFNRNPIQYLLTAISETSHSGMIWIDVVKPYTCLSIILSFESHIVNQFLLTDESVLSWDAALRQNWQHIFKDSKKINKMDNFGRCSRFSKASNLCLARAFSFSRTNIGGYYYSCIASEAQVALSQNISNPIDLKGFIDDIVGRSLLSIFFGSYESDYEHILRLTRIIHKSLEKSCSYDSRALKAKNEFVKVISKLLIKRSNDPETYSNDSDYVQWLLTHGSKNELSVGSTVFCDSLFNVENNNSSVNIENQQKKNQNFLEILKIDIPLHLLVSVLSTWIICTNSILWVIVNQYRVIEKEVPFDPNPLFLVRRARKDILIGKFLVPKNTYLSVCSSVSNIRHVICARIEKRLKEYQLSHTNNIIQDKGNTEEYDFQSESHTNPKIDQKSQQNVDKTRIPKTYIPSYRSKPFAILIALFELNKETLVSKEEILNIAKHYHDTSDSKSLYSLWHGMKILLEKEYVYKTINPTRYYLTDSGREIATAISNLPFPKENNTKKHDSLIYTEISKEKNTIDQEKSIKQFHMSKNSNTNVQKNKHDEIYLIKNLNQDTEMTTE